MGYNLKKCLKDNPRGGIFGCLKNTKILIKNLTKLKKKCIIYIQGKKP